ncbi:MULTISPECIES: MATE family efflux transporter [unclassified Viridibacillus]|uniref:MATE family efflux transporter n=1 Tax=unclassified Viridibacillus TaxID=2617942 RepID=UPI00096C21CE|nr:MULTISPECIES: MATE family efflux transporter [unclassified Viridibacillus]OMC84782.1 MATE family efflux transporter [Viridibacillus sp. FSL H8-0123]OMC85874.1 MATE family efflux transporter [Viridibacillus sp. FSL H7-0596]
MNELFEKKTISISKPMIAFLTPVILASIIQSLGQVFGIIIVGQTLGVDSLAALSAFFPLFFFLITFAVGIGSGSSILIGQSYGGGNMTKLKEIVGVTLAFTIVISVVGAIFGSVFTGEILKWMGTPKNIIGESVEYAQILFITLPITFINMVYTTFMRGVGDSKTPFYFLIISVILNLLLLPILIFGWFGLPEYGLNGAAYAAVLSSLISLVLLIGYLHKSNHILKLDRMILRHFHLKGAVLKALLKLALPSSISMVAMAMSEIAVITFVNSYGSNATAAYGVANQIASYVQIPAISISIAISVFVAQSVGSGDISKIKKIEKIGIKLNYLLGGLLILIVYLLSNPILKIFLDNGEAIDIAHNLILISFWSYVILGHTQSISATMRATGTVLWPTIFTISSIWIIEVPVAYFLSHNTTLGLNGIWIGYPMAFIVNFIVQSMYQQLFWKKKTLNTMFQ